MASSRQHAQKLLFARGSLKATRRRKNQTRIECGVSLGRKTHRKAEEEKDDFRLAHAYKCRLDRGQRRLMTINIITSSLSALWQGCAQDPTSDSSECAASVHPSLFKTHPILGVVRVARWTRLGAGFCDVGWGMRRCEGMAGCRDGAVRESEVDERADAGCAAPCIQRRRILQTASIRCCSIGVWRIRIC